MLHTQQPPWYFSLPYMKYIQSHFDKFPPQICPDSLVSHLREWHHHSGVLARHTHIFSLLHSHCRCPRSILFPSPTCLMPKASNLSSSFCISPNNHSVSSALLGLSPKFSPPFLLIPSHFIPILVLLKPVPSFRTQVQSGYNVMPSLGWKYFDVFPRHLDKYQSLEHGWRGSVWSGPYCISHFIP